MREQARDFSNKSTTEPSPKISRILPILAKAPYFRNIEFGHMQGQLAYIGAMKTITKSAKVIVICVLLSRSKDKC